MKRLSVLLLFLCFIQPLQAQTCDHIEWIAPTLTIGGDPITSPLFDPPLVPLTYRVYNVDQVLGEGPFTVISEINGVTTLRAECDDFNLPDGDYIFTVTAINARGEESARSNEVAFTVKRITFPATPTGLQVF